MITFLYSVKTGNGDSTFTSHRYHVTCDGAAGDEKQLQGKLNTRLLLNYNAAKCRGDRNTFTFTLSVVEILMAFNNNIPFFKSVIGNVTE